MKKILVTGADGFVGSHLARALDRRYRIYACVLHERKSPAPTIEDVRFDITNYGQTLSALKKIRPDIVIHLAGIVPGPAEKIAAFRHVNVGGTRNLLRAMQATGAKELVYLSSLMVYGPIHRRAVRENDKLSPSSPYGKSKLVAEKICQTYAKSAGIKVRILRAPGIIGPSRGAGFVASWIRAARQNKIIEIPSDGSDWWDLVSIKDVTNVVDRMLRSLNYGTFEVLNIGQGSPVRPRRVASVIITESRSKSQLITTGRKPLIRLYADIGKVKKELGFKPRDIYQEIAALARKR